MTQPRAWSAPKLVAAAAPPDEVNPELRALLEALASSLRREPAPLQLVETLGDRLACLDARRQHLVVTATRARRDATRRLIDGERGEDQRRDLWRTLRSIVCTVDIVGTWPRDSEPPLVRIEPRYARCDLAELVRASCHAFRPLATERELQLRVDAPPELPSVVDPEKVQHVILNLLFNAFKVTPVDGSIDVVLERREEGDEARLSVVDSGVGVATGIQEVIFSRHQRSERCGPIAADWLGFDLGASRDYMALHGGGLRLVPRPRGAGAEFRVHLPLAPPAGTPTDGEPASLERAERVARVAMQELHIEARLGEEVPADEALPSVLVVEDSRVVQQIIVRAFAGRCNVVSALDGPSGLRKATEQVPDLIVADLGLPGLDGVEMVRAMRERPELAGTPILVVSGRHDAAETVQLLRDGVQDVMNKPFLVRELRARAYNLLEAKRARDVLGALVGQRESDLGRMAAQVTRKQRRLEAALDELCEARELAEGASRVKSNFLRMISHELKTPVTALLLQLQILSQEPALIDGPDRVKRGFGSMERSISRLLHIVDTVLEWARVESGRFRVEAQSFDLREAVRGVVDELTPQAENRGITIDVQAPDDLPAARNDGRLVRLVAVNLIERAIHVTPEGRIAVTIACVDGRHELRVTDGGPPLSVAERRELFDALEAARDLGRARGAGSGLGLHVVQDLARAIKGEISLAGESTAGSAVTFTFGDED